MIQEFIEKFNKKTRNILIFMIFFIVSYHFIQLSFHIYDTYKLNQEVNLSLEEVKKVDSIIFENKRSEYETLKIGGRIRYKEIMEDDMLTKDEYKEIMNNKELFKESFNTISPKKDSIVY